MKIENTTIKEKLVTCQCCGLRHKDYFPAYSICPFCNWENDPCIKEDTDYSSANKSTLESFKKNVYLQ